MDKKILVPRNENFLVPVVGLDSRRELRALVAAALTAHRAVIHYRLLQVPSVDQKETGDGKNHLLFLVRC